jgi:DNA polymerase III alpha subunit
VGEAGARIEEFQPFNTFGDFYKRVPKSVVGSNVMKALIKAGCFDSLGEDRNRLGRMIDVPVKGKGKKKVSGVIEEEQQQLM